VHIRFIDDLDKDQDLFGVFGVVGVWHGDNSFRSPSFCASQARLHARRASNAPKCCGVARMARFEPPPHKHLHPVHTNQNAVAGLRFITEDLSKESCLAIRFRQAQRLKGVSLSWTSQPS
jgi:hypothetical protein